MWDHSGKHTRSRRYLYCFWVFRSAPLGKFGREIACEPLPLFQRHMYWEVSDVEKRDGGIFSFHDFVFAYCLCRIFFAGAWLFYAFFARISFSCRLTCMIFWLFPTPLPNYFSNHPSLGFKDLVQTILFPKYSSFEETVLFWKSFFCVFAYS